ncbi:MAG: hypothetical protein JXO49_06345 [Deltaproteobacteria bacterium]|nr:hypothetical protein [Candidatus Anaeroferrophillus wilburensis]MBN2888946.1 hypothetical protein [Deltaproteobacteria bacterium]
MNVQGHENCFACRQGFCLNTIAVVAGGLDASLLMEKRHEGWLDIPHGGIGISALIDLADLAWLQETGRNLPYPCSLSLKFGDVCRLGDQLQMTARMNHELRRVELQMKRQGEEKNYLAGAAEPVADGNDDACLPLPPVAELESAGMLRALSIYENCFICGNQRQAPGIGRRFFQGSFAGQDYILARYGFAAADAAVAHWFQQGQEMLHPGVIGAVLDEICGWSGFIAGELFGVTVRLDLTFQRPVGVAEKLIFASPTPRVKGRSSRQVYYATGQVLSLDNDGGYELVAAASGQWLVVPRLRQQFYDTRVEEKLDQVSF